MSLASAHKNEVLKSLNDLGYGILKGVLSKSECASIFESLNTIETERRIAKDIFLDEQRVILWDLHLTHPDVYLDMINIPEVMEVIKEVLKETVILASFGAIRNQGNYSKKNTHIDSRVPIRDFESTIQMVAMFCISDFTVENGSTYVWPLSHRSGLNPKEIYPIGADLPGKIQCEAKAGDIIMFLGQTWHDIAPNLTGEKRWGILSYYGRWWCKPTYDYTQCGPEIFSLLTPEQKILFGFNSRPPKSASFRVNTVMPIDALPTEYYAALKS